MSAAEAWMQTATGKVFHPIVPRPEELNIIDIARALSKQCRYAGHCLEFYSVAEHSCFVADAAPDELKLTALMHDASEAYLTDIPRPIKPFLDNYMQLEDQLMEIISVRFETVWPLPPEVKRLDNAILADEQQQNMAEAPMSWNLPEPPLGIVLEYWDPKRAAREFLHRFKQYGGIA